MEKKLSIRVDEKLHKELKKKVIDVSYPGGIQHLTVDLYKEWLKKKK